MTRMRRALPLVLMVSAMGAIAACSDRSTTAPLDPASSRIARFGDDTSGKVCYEWEGEVVCIDKHPPKPQ